MTRQNFTEIVAIVDKSASMGVMLTETISGFNSFLKEQKEIEDDTNLSLILFNDKTQYLYDNIPIKEVKDLDSFTYQPSSMTAMNDAIGTAIDTVGSRLATMEESARPSKVIVLIITDGQENSSKEYSTSQIKEKIDIQQNKFSWEFIFLGANINVEQTAKKYGFKSGKFATYSQDSVGTKAVFDSMSMAVTHERGYLKSSSGLSRGVDISYNLQDEYNKAEK